jgi:hypothetical protein
VRRAALVAVLALGAVAPSAWASPDISVAVHGPVGGNGWYVDNVIVNWTVSDTQAFTVNVGCEPSILLSTDTTGTIRQCKATSQDGTDSSKSVLVRIDKTPPSASVAADRSADAGGFYNHALTANWTGSDATSGIASCTSTPYSGPDGSGISLSGTCKDKAGNVSAEVPFVFNYDSTPPVLGDVTVRADDAGARLAWQASGASRIMVTRSSGPARAAQSGVVYDGTGSGFTDTGLKNGAKYTYLVQAFDHAGNAASDSVVVTPAAEASAEHLLSPGFQSKVSRAPMLRWREVRRASYYNVQLFRKGKKILSAWPTKPHYQLRKVWTYRGKRHRLMPGTYWWYLWAGYGHRSEHRYGKLLGRRSFTVA